MWFSLSLIKISPFSLHSPGKGWGRGVNQTVFQLTGYFSFFDKHQIVESVGNTKSLDYSYLNQTGCDRNKQPNIPLVKIRTDPFTFLFTWSSKQWVIFQQFKILVFYEFDIFLEQGYELIKLEVAQVFTQNSFIINLILCSSS